MTISDSWGNTITPSYSMTVVPVPSIVSLNPASCTVSTNATAGCTTGAFPLQISGANFFIGLSAYWDGTSIGGTAINANLLATSVPHSLLTAGTHLVSVGTAAGVSTGRIAFVVNPAPVLYYLAPNPVTTGSAAFTMTLTGVNFLPGMRVQWQGAAGGFVLIPTTVSTTQIQVTVPAGLAATGGVAGVTVLSADPIPVASNTQTIALAPPPPSLVITTSSPLSQATVGVTYSNAFAATGGDGLAYNFTVLSGVLPPGLTLSLAGKLAGSPTNPGTFTFTVQVADDSGDTASQSFRAGGESGAAHHHHAAIRRHAGGHRAQRDLCGAGRSAAVHLFQFGNAAAECAVQLRRQCDGDAEHAGNVRIYRDRHRQRPEHRQPGLHDYRNGHGAGIVTTSPLTSGQVGVAYPGVQFQASGGLRPVHPGRRVRAPPGMSFSAAGALSGTPTAAGSYSIAVTVTDTRESHRQRQLYDYHHRAGHHHGFAAQWHRGDAL